MIHPRIYDALFAIWKWYADKVLGVPFAVKFTPPPGNKLMAITYSWSLEYVQRIQADYNLRPRYDQLVKDLEKSQTRVSELEDLLKKKRNRK